MSARTEAESASAPAPAAARASGALSARNIRLNY